MKITIKELKQLIAETKDRKARIPTQKQINESLFGESEPENVNKDTVTEISGMKQLALAGALATGIAGGVIHNNKRGDIDSAEQTAVHRVVDAPNSRTSHNDIAQFIGADQFAKADQIEKLLVQRLQNQGERFVELAGQTDDVGNISAALQTIADMSSTLTDEEKALVRTYASRLR